MLRMRPRQCGLGALLVELRPEHGRLQGPHPDGLLAAPPRMIRDGERSVRLKHFANVRRQVWDALREHQAGVPDDRQ